MFGYVPPVQSRDVEQVSRDSTGAPLGARLKEPPFALILTLFVLSGVTGLVDQLCFSKYLSYVVGSTAHAVSAKLGKHAVSCTDRAGFIVNALLFPYLNDAVKMLEAHYATADDIDAAMKVGCGYPMGPFELLDVVGLDVSLAIEKELYIEFREPGFAPAPLLEHLVTAGYLGRKSGRGFRTYA